MPNTTNFNWATPADTDLVKDGAAAIRTLGDSIDTSLVDLKGGTTGQVLTKASNADLDFTFSSVDPLVILDAKGDLISATAADTPARLAVGANGTILMADSTASTGIKWDTGAYASYTPGSITGFTQGNGTVSGRFRQFGKTVFFNLTLTLGSTSAITGGLVIQFPVSANTANNGCFFGQSRFADAGTQEYIGTLVQNGTNFYTAAAINASGTYAANQGISSTIPFTWTTSDVIFLSGTYEAA